MKRDNCAPNGPNHLGILRPSACASAHSLLVPDQMVASGVSPPRPPFPPPPISPPAPPPAGAAAAAAAGCSFCSNRLLWRSFCSNVLSVVATAGRPRAAGRGGLLCAPGELPPLPSPPPPHLLHEETHTRAAGATEDLPPEHTHTHTHTHKQSPGCFRAPRRWRWRSSGPR